MVKIYPFLVNQELFQLKRVEFLSESKIRSIQEQRLSRLLLHAYQNVPYYRQILCSSGVVKKDGTLDLKKFTTIPFLTKEILRTHFEELKSVDIGRRKFYYNTSGGSTGVPVCFLQDAEYKRWARAVQTLYDNWTGYHTGMPKVLLWGSERDLFVGRETLGVRLKRWLKNEEWLNAFRMTETEMYQYVEAINRHKPVQILSM